MAWSSKCFFNSADVGLDLKVFVGSLQLRSLSHAPGGAAECCA